MDTPVCFTCTRSTYVSKAGRNRTGSQRLWCAACQRYFTPDPRPMGYPAELRHRAVQLYLEGTGIRAIGRLLHVNHQRVTNWITAHAAQLPDEVTDSTPTDTIEIDELYTFVGQKKP